MNGAGRVLLPVALVAAAAATLAFRTAVEAPQLYDRKEVETYTRAAEVLHALGAVRVRSDRQDAGQRVEDSRKAAHLLVHHPAIARVIRPDRAAAEFSKGRLLYADRDTLKRVLTDLEAGRVPESLPAGPDVLDYFPSRCTCEVVLRDRDALDVVAAVLPDAELSGEPVALREEAQGAAPVTRALLAAVVLACVLGGWRKKSLAEGEVRLLAAALPLLLLGLMEWGADPWTVLALAVVCSAPRSAPLVAAGVVLLFASQVLQREGLVLLLGALVRAAFPPRLSLRPARETWVALAGSAGLVLLSFIAPLRGPVLPEAVRSEPAASLVPRPQRAAEAARLSEAGFEAVTDAGLLPAPADAEGQRLLLKIFRRAERLAVDATGTRRDQLQTVATAAALDSLHLPRDLRVRFRTTDGRAAVWVQPRDAKLLDEHPEVIGSSAYRVRGSYRLRREGRWAGLAVFALGGLLLVWRLGRYAATPVQFGAAGLLAGGFLLYALDTPAHPVLGEATYPLLACVALGPSLWLMLPLAGAAAFAPTLLLPHAAALALAVLVASVPGLSTRRRGVAEPAVALPEG
ncbi:MAG: hypothetical protein O7C98_12085 [Planctomycetota bacterium]|nr:hypothetical protein [Planctomycetota bacterium]